MGAFGRAPAPAYAAACDPAVQECHLFGVDSPAPTWTTYGAGTDEIGLRFKSSQAVELVSVSWYRAAASPAPDAMRLWNVTTGTLVWSYNDLPNFGDSAIGWKTQTIPSTLRHLLTANQEYVLAYGKTTGGFPLAVAYMPVGDGPLTVLGGRHNTNPGAYPNGDQPDYYGIDAGFRTAGAATPTPAPTSTPTATPTPAPTGTPGPTATPAPGPSVVTVSGPVEVTGLVPGLAGIQAAIASLQTGIAAVATEIAGVREEIGHLPERFGELFVPDPDYGSWHLAQLNADLHAKLPILTQVEDSRNYISAALVEAECATWEGLTLTMPPLLGGSFNVPGSLFLTLWCPWKPVVGAGIALFATWSAGRRVLRLVGGSSQQ